MITYDFSVVPTTQEANNVATVIDKIYSYKMYLEDIPRNEFILWLEQEIPCQIESGITDEGGKYVKTITMREEDYTMFLLKHR
jgi:negative regulator of sigma E activity